MLSWERSGHRQGKFAASGAVSEGWEFRGTMIFWSVEVRGDSVLSVWQRQLANEVLLSAEALQPWSLFF